MPPCSWTFSTSYWQCFFRAFRYTVSETASVHLYLFLWKTFPLYLHISWCASFTLCMCVHISVHWHFAYNCSCLCVEMQASSVSCTLSKYLRTWKQFLYICIDVVRTYVHTHIRYGQNSVTMVKAVTKKNRSNGLGERRIAMYLRTYVWEGLAHSKDISLQFMSLPLLFWQ